MHLSIDWCKVKEKSWRKDMYEEKTRKDIAKKERKGREYSKYNIDGQKWLKEINGPSK